MANNWKYVNDNDWGARGMFLEEKNGEGIHQMVLGQVLLCYRYLGIIQMF